jgi:hypothetical protein
LFGAEIVAAEHSTAGLCIRPSRRAESYGEGSKCTPKIASKQKKDSVSKAGLKRDARSSQVPKPSERNTRSRYFPGSNDINAVERKQAGAS